MFWFWVNRTDVIALITTQKKKKKSIINSGSSLSSHSHSLFRMHSLPFMQGALTAKNSTGHRTSILVLQGPAELKVKCTISCKMTSIL